MLITIRAFKKGLNYIEFIVNNYRHIVSQENWCLLRCDFSLLQRMAKIFTR